MLRPRKYELDVRSEIIEHREEKIENREENQEPGARTKSFDLKIVLILDSYISSLKSNISHLTSITSLFSLLYILFSQVSSLKSHISHLTSHIY